MVKKMCEYYKYCDRKQTDRKDSNCLCYGKNSKCEIIPKKKVRRVRVLGCSVGKGGRGFLVTDKGWIEIHPFIDILIDEKWLKESK